MFDSTENHSIWIGKLVTFAQIPLGHWFHFEDVSHIPSEEYTDSVWVKVSKTQVRPLGKKTAFSFRKLKTSVIYRGSMENYSNDLAALQ